MRRKVKLDSGGKKNEVRNNKQEDTDTWVNLTRGKEQKDETEGTNKITNITQN